MTREVPEERLGMAAVAKELKAWASAPRVVSVAELEVKDLAEALKDMFLCDRQPLDLRNRRKETVERIAAGMASQAQQMIDVVNQVGLDNTGFVDEISFSVEVLQKAADAIEGRERVAAYRTCNIGPTVFTGRQGTLSSGVGAALSIDNQVALAAGHTIRSASGAKEFWSESAIVALDSLEQDQESARLVEGLLANFKPALQALLMTLSAQA
jgi:hypothetical protein